MNETPTTYETKENQFSVAQSISFRIKQIGEMSELQNMTGKNRSVISQDAIDLLYAVSNNKAYQELIPNSGLSMIEIVTQSLELMLQTRKENGF